MALAHFRQQLLQLQHLRPLAFASRLSTGLHAASDSYSSSSAGLHTASKAAGRQQSLFPQLSDEDITSPHPPTLGTGPLTVRYPFALEHYRDREALVYNLEHRPQGVVALDGNVFNVPVRVDILHRVVRFLRAKWRQGTHMVKTRAEVSGGGKKPWQQKKTGRARHGSIRSPLWKGGGTTFGPRPRSHAHKLYLNVQLMGLKCALSAKANEGRLVIVDSLAPAEKTPKTKVMGERLEKLMTGMHAQTALLVDTDDRGSDGGAKLRQAAGNLQWADVMPLRDVTVYHLLRSQALIITKPALEQLAARLSKPAHPGRKPTRLAWWQQQQAAFKLATQELLAASPQ